MQPTDDTVRLVGRCNSCERRGCVNPGSAAMIGEIASESEMPLGAPTSVPVERLVLDRRNPRLIAVGEELEDAGIIAALYQSEDLSELLESIASNGYMDIEPLIVLEDGDRFIVLEGNRRLAAIRLFREPGLEADVSRARRVRIRVPHCPEKYRGTLDYVTVYRVASREEARPFIGFKHINGAAKWESYAKAKFAADWYRGGEVTLAGIASRIGDRHDTVKRMVNATYVLEQAKATSKFSIDDRMSRRFNFSHLYTALSRQAYMQFLGLGAAWSSFEPKSSPVHPERLERLREILKWLYGSREHGVPPVVTSQNPHIKHLGEVLLSDEGLTVLRATGSLAEAHSSSQPAGGKFSAALLRARREIRDAANSLRGFDGRDSALVDIAEDISETAQAIHERMKKKMLSVLRRGE